MFLLRIRDRERHRTAWGGHCTEQTYTGRGGHRTYFLDYGTIRGGGDTAYTLLMRSTIGVGRPYNIGRKTQLGGRVGSGLVWSGQLLQEIDSQLSWESKMEPECGNCASDGEGVGNITSTGVLRFLNSFFLWFSSLTILRPYYPWALWSQNASRSYRALQS